MNAYVFDMECNGLTPTKIHCLSYRELGSDAKGSLTNYDDMREFLLGASKLIGHRITLFDIPNLNRLLGIKIGAELVDTMAISWYIEPQRLKHGLEEYGEEFGVKKPPVADWDNLSIEEYVHRCEQDVEINVRLWRKQWATLVGLYESEAEANRLVSYLSFKMDCVREQEELGWKLDVDRCTNVLAKLTEERDKKLVELKAAMPKVPVVSVKKRPAKMYKMNGMLSKAGEDWVLFCENRGLDPEVQQEVEYIKDYIEPNPASHDQVKSWLFTLGWKPQTFKFQRNKETGEVRKLPQVAQDKTKGPGLCPSVLKLAEIDPKVEALNGLFILNHRITILEGFLENVDGEGKLKASIGGFTNTLRLKHRIIVNLPGVQTAYGEDIRGCLIAPKGEELMGSDMSGLEDRLKQHYIYPYDPEYVKEMLSDDFDPHLDLAVRAGAVSERDSAVYKSAEHKDALIKGIRHTYKQGNYASQYGAGIPRLALTIGCSTDDARRIYEAYWQRNWAVKEVAANLTVKPANGMMWLYNPISRFWYSLRYDKDRFSTLVQGSGVFCFDSWVREVRKAGLGVIGQFHDEIVAPVALGHREEITNVVKSCINRVNKRLKLNRELDVDTQYGANYAEIH